jgi:glycosyltransferase involved in cell wall biosynthesis
MACVARLSAAYKGQDLLLETLAGDAWRGRDWHLSFCGSGPDRAHLEGLARLYGLADRVQWKGHLPDVRSIWAEHEILVLPSRSEGTPLALVEAMVCGRPAVVTDAGGNAERIEEGVSGFVAEGATVRSFAAALERAWASRDRWREMGGRAREVALSRLDPDPGSSLLTLLSRAVAARTGASPGIAQDIPAPAPERPNPLTLT